MKPDRRSSEAERRFQVLALDGGGLKGLFSAAILAGIEADLGHPVEEHFDLVAGTSTGGVIALGLGVGVRPSEIVEFYAKEGPGIFRDRMRLRSAAHLLTSKYPRRRIQRAFKRVFGEARLGDSTKPL